MVPDTAFDTRRDIDGLYTQMRLVDSLVAPGSAEADTGSSNSNSSTSFVCGALPIA